jgi:hypothetical protein
MFARSIRAHKRLSKKTRWREKSATIFTRLAD